jgi:hypothetical protein
MGGIPTIGTPKPGIPFGRFWCPDCGYALVWREKNTIPFYEKRIERAKETRRRKYEKRKSRQVRSIYKRDL